MKKNFYRFIIFSLFLSALSISASKADSTARLQYPEYSDLEYIEEPDSETSVNQPKRANKSAISDTGQASSKSKTYDELVAIIEASIKICHADLAQRYIVKLQAVGDSRSTVKVEQLNDALKTKLVQILQHKNNLKNLAIATQIGDISSIKAAVRASMKTVSCPDDRDQLIKVVKSIKTALKREAEEKQRVMNAAISKGQTVQNEEIQQRRVIAQSLLLLVGVLNLDASVSNLSTVNQLQLTDDLTDMGLKGVQKMLESQYSAAETSSARCVVDGRLSSAEQHKNKVYYVLTSTDDDNVSRYQIKAVAENSATPEGLVLGPYNTYATADMIVGVVCPAR